MKIVVTAKTSCDEAFIIRVANKDPFEYWNRCITPGTSREEFPEGGPKEMFVEIEETDKMPYNYKITYTFQSILIAYSNHHNTIEAIIMYFGSIRTKVEFFNEYTNKRIDI